MSENKQSNIAQNFVYIVVAILIFSGLIYECTKHKKKETHPSPQKLHSSTGLLFYFTLIFFKTFALKINV